MLLTVLLLLGCAAVGVATTFAVHNFLTSRLDQQLTLAGNRYAVSLEHDDHDADNSPETATVGQAVGTLGARLLHGDLTAVGVIPAEEDDPVAITAALRVAITTAAAGGSVQTLDLPGLGNYRILVTPGRDGDVLVTGLPLAPIDETVDRLIVTESMVFVVVVLVIGLIGGIAVRRALRPLERVTETALRISEMPLDSGDVDLRERFPDSDQRTEVGKVGSAVNRMLGQVEAALNVRQASEDRLRQFIADASHELRTPLAIVRSHAELIELRLPEDPDSVRESLRSIRSGTQRMGRLVDDLLLLARLDSGLPLADDVVDLTVVVLESVGDARIAGKDHRWMLDLPENPVSVRGDENRLRQAVINLLANARLHTPGGTTVTVVLQVDDEADQVEISVVDDGPGIPPELLPAITERFVRGSGGRATSEASSGLGLPIVVGILAAHRGHLDVSSEPGRTRMRMVLPAPIGYRPTVEALAMPTHVHLCVPGADADAVPLVLLHGSDGSESDLLGLAQELAPGATRLAIRGTVETEGGHAFFQRFPDRRIDEVDLDARVPALARMIQKCCAENRLTRQPIVIGFSNGAIMAAALLMRAPNLLAGAILFRPLSPYVHDRPQPLAGIPVLIVDGENDSRRAPGDGRRLAERLSRSGALVTHRLLPVGHPITAQDRDIAREWLRSSG